MLSQSLSVEKCLKKDRKLAGLRKELEKAQVREDYDAIEKLEREIQRRERILKGERDGNDS